MGNYTLLTNHGKQIMTSTAYKGMNISQYNMLKMLWTPQRQSHLQTIIDNYEPSISCISALSLHIRDSGLRCPVDSNDFDEVTVDINYDLVVFITCDVELYPNYVCQLGQFCKVQLHQRTSNLDLYTITCSGAGGLSYNYDIIGIKQAHEMWNQIVMSRKVTDDLLQKFYQLNQ